MITDLRTAEMIKYASNAFLATRLSFINEIASICDQMGADVKEVAEGMGYDKRIGAAFLGAGLGWGGSCFPKDVQALAYMASTHGTHPQLLRAVIDINRYQRRRAIHQLREWLGGLDERVIGLLGLSFKPNTDDMRSAPAIEIAHLLQNEGARVKAYDPAAMENARRFLPGVELCADPYQVAEGSDALIVVTEWNEFKQIDKARLLERMGQPYLIDGRNVYDCDEMRQLGCVYWGMGRGRRKIVIRYKLFVIGKAGGKRGQFIELVEFIEFLGSERVTRRQDSRCRMQDAGYSMLDDSILNCGFWNGKAEAGGGTRFLESNGAGGEDSGRLQHAAS